MGTLKALVGGNWVPILGGGGVNEVVVSPDVPTDPNVELWYDTDDPGVSLVGTWTTFTPTVTQPGVIAGNVIQASYVQIGKTVHAQCRITMTGAGTGNNAMRVALPPIAPHTRAQNSFGGAGQYYRSSTTTRYIVGVYIAVTDVVFGIDGVSSDLLGISPNIAIASGDQFYYQITYEAA